MKWLYKYPQREFPYARLIEENRRRQGQGPEFELLDTGIFDDDRYFDVVRRVREGDPRTSSSASRCTTAGPEAAPLHVLPHLWFRNTWAWGAERGRSPVIEPGPPGPRASSASWPTTRNAEPLRNLPFELPARARATSTAKPGARLLFTDNETNAPRVLRRRAPRAARPT